MRKILIGLVAAAAIAIPFTFASSANAAVTVDKGIGHVDKGDIQASSVLNMNNAKFQTAAEKGKITFSANVENIVDYKMTCLGSAEFGHRVIHQPVRYNVTATPVTNGGGNQILGFDFNAELGAPISAGTAWMETIPCADGAPLWSNAGVSQYSNGITGGLQVTFDGKSYDLPNTPAPIVEPAPVA